MENKLVSLEVMLSDQAVGTAAELHGKSVVVHTVAFCSEPGFLWIAVIQHSYLHKHKTWSGFKCSVSERGVVTVSHH